MIKFRRRGWLGHDVIGCKFDGLLHGSKLAVPQSSTLPFLDFSTTARQTVPIKRHLDHRPALESSHLWPQTGAREPVSPNSHRWRNQAKPVSAISYLPVCSVQLGDFGSTCNPCRQPLCPLCQYDASRRRSELPAQILLGLRSHSSGSVQKEAMQDLIVTVPQEHCKVCSKHCVARGSDVRIQTESWTH